ncbi:MAG: DUF4198 domain-containing protein [Candidatus Adiutrix sp.]|jgi:uncharacterized GH25 family protein|nr:DUF4198 domain-containing protein [Candidatus Adiutrix sp.]
MRQVLVFCAALAIATAAPALAHDFWIIDCGAQEGAPLTVLLGNGHNFPQGEEIKADQVSERYEPLRALGPDGELALKPGPEPRLAVSEKPLAKGTYLLLAASKASFSTQSPEGWVRKPKDEVPGAVKCGFGANFAKAVVNVGAAEVNLIKKPVGQKLEIVPQVNPAGVKVGQNFPVQVLLDGKPLPNTRLGAYFAGFGHEGDSQAFSALTDKTGLVNIIPLRSGTWLAKVSTKEHYADPAKCDTENYSATLAFTIAD